MKTRTHGMMVILNIKFLFKETLSQNRGGDIGEVTGAFFGPRHEGMGGVLERHDLSAAFGGKR